ncbi:zinc-dependent peptidase, partial [Xanthovirga aplysinae]|uniref:zinc-dependent peptidase n=1 Tax=Xanthovirga aplysinae TaxID=2529853 RepID=UPI0012BCCFAB
MQPTALFIFIGLIGVPVSLFYFFKIRKNWKSPSGNFPPQWRKILSEKVAFYNSLNEKEKVHFEYKVEEFLLNHRITGVSMTIDKTDKLLVSASAVIPIFKFPDWRYDNLFEVLIYPDHFNANFSTEGKDRNILGMVGTGYMEGKMILSQKALHHGFANENDKKNTAIHEFVHLVDKMDGRVDGIPEILLEKQYTIPWLDLMNKKIGEIYAEKSDINPYGATNQAEFFAVSSEYFFEHPKALQRKHPKLYALLEEIFEHDMTEREQELKNTKISRNAPCLCGSGKKYK